MKGRILSLLSAAALTVATAACSSSGKYFQFQASSSAYHGTTAAKTASAPAAETAPATASAALEAVPVPTTPAASAPAAAAQAQAALKALPAAEQVRLEKKITKLANKLEQRAAKLAAKPEAPAAEGKSQIIALVLVVLLGGLGIHRFYLGYTGIGIAQLLTLGGCGIWALIDLVRIITGDLKPKGGDYTEKF